MMRLLVSSFLVTVVLTALAPRTLAQDVTVTPPISIGPSGTAPDTPPSFKKAWAIDYPSELTGTPLYGYVIIDTYIDQKGKLTAFAVEGTYPNFINAVKESSSAMRCIPAQDKGAAVGAWCQLTVIFNPAVASATAPDASPRLVAIVPVILKDNQMAALKGASTVIWANATIDDQGLLKTYTLEPEYAYAEKLKSEINAALAQWKFAPGRKDGQPAAMQCRIPLKLAYAPDAPAQGGKSTPPQVISRAAPKYPVAMKRSGLRGTVTIKFIVDKQGRVTSPEIMESNNPGFNDAAIDAVLQWKFKPGTVAGRPVNTWVQIPIVFHLDGGGQDAFSVDKPSKKQQASMPEELRYDTPPAPKGVILPVYPYALLAENTKGKATVGMLVSKEGVVVKAAVQEATQVEFGESALAAVESFTFTPALLNGSPTAALLKMDFEFNTYSILISRADLDLLALDKKKSSKIVGSSKLDGPLKPKSIRAATMPLNITSESGGEAVVEFLVDTEGTARLPRVVSATETALGYAAVQAVAQWRFEPPLANGKHVITRVRVPVKFEALEAAAKPTSEE